VDEILELLLPLHPVLLLLLVMMMMLGVPRLDLLDLLLPLLLLLVVPMLHVPSQQSAGASHHGFASCASEELLTLAAVVLIFGVGPDLAGLRWQQQQRLSCEEAFLGLQSLPVVCKLP
jgi:hypothetical protein